ncbi:MAG: hypothetical protein LBR36_08500 [Bacteroidales bacterium]|jgi:preprotein translocase subunit Sss1|nr:hypothetical protein [Bacteroidales bacterium]
MNAIKNNPYRILGLLAGASQREITRQTNNLKKFIAAGAEMPSDFSFSALDNLHRTTEAIDNAISKLNLDDDKMFAALFWFWKGNEITDEPALEALKAGDSKTAYQIWDKLVCRNENGNKIWNEVTHKNASAFHNRSVLMLLNKGLGSVVSAVMANIYFIESEYFTEFAKGIVDVTYKISKKDIELKFLEAIINDIGSFLSLVRLLQDYNFAAKTDFFKSVSQKFTANITSQIEIARKSRIANKQQAATAGENLYKNTQDDLTQLKSIFGTTDLSYSGIVDKVANEILQCAIDFFQDSYTKGLEADYLTKATNLVVKAKGLAMGAITKGRIDETLQALQARKDYEIKQAIEALKSIKAAYERACKQIDKEVESYLGWNQSINWSKVDEIKRNAIDWDKVNELLLEILSDKNIEKIRNCTSAAQKQNFVELAEWLKNHSTNNTFIRRVLDKYHRKITNSTKDAAKRTASATADIEQYNESKFANRITKLEYWDVALKVGLCIYCLTGIGFIIYFIIDGTWEGAIVTFFIGLAAAKIGFVILSLVIFPFSSLVLWILKRIYENKEGIQNKEEYDQTEQISKPDKIKKHYSSRDAWWILGLVGAIVVGTLKAYNYYEIAADWFYYKETNLIWQFLLGAIIGGGIGIIVGVIIRKIYNQKNK